MERILVIGCSGLLGSRLMALGENRYKVFGTYNMHEVKAENAHRLDVLDRANVSKLVNRIKPDCVFDTHAITNVDYCETHQEEAWKSNVEGSRNIAEACKSEGCKYVLMSTDYVFDGTKLKYTEKDKPHPLNYYAKTKLIAEYMLAALDINYIVARSAVLYGNGGAGKVSFPIWLINELKAKKKVRIVSDQHNNPTYSDSLVEFLFRLCDKDETGIFHIAGKECVSRLEFAKDIAHVFGLDTSLISQITSSELNQVAIRPNNLNLSTEKAERVSGLKALTVNEGLSLFKKQLEG